MTWPASIASAVAGAVAAAADFNSHRDALKAIGDAWPGYTPVLTSNSSAPTIGNSAISGSYRLMGKTADVHMNVTIGSTFSAGTGIYRLSLPSGAVPLSTSSAEAMGIATVLDVSASQTYFYHVLYVSSTTVSMVNSVGAVGGSAPMTWATGDRISVHIPSLQIV